MRQLNSLIRMVPVLRNSPVETREPLFLFLIFLTAFFARVAFFFLYSGDASYPGFFAAPWAAGDDAYYEKLATTIITSGPSRINDNPSMAELHPLYPYFLATIYKLFGHHYFTIRVVQALLSSCTAILVYFIAKKIFNERVAYISSIFAVVSPMSIYTSARFLTETLFTFLLCVAIYLLLRIDGKKSFSDFVAAGFFVGLCCLTRNMLVGYVFFVVVWFISDRFSSCCIPFSKRAGSVPDPEAIAIASSSFTLPENNA